MQQTITPNSVRFHYDAQEGKWRMKASRNLKDDTGNYYQQVIEVLDALLPLLTLLFQFWAIAGAPITLLRNSPEESWATFLSGLDGLTEDVYQTTVALPTPTPDTSELIEDDFPIYPGESEGWGETEP